MVDDMCQGVQELFVGHARALEAQERWEDAESAWVAAGDPGLAVAMHRRNGDLAAMFRAVTQHQPVSTARQMMPSMKQDHKPHFNKLVPVSQRNCAQSRTNAEPLHFASPH